MREFIPSDYVDKEGNVYETVGENIREGHNGGLPTDFPTPEEIGVGGLIGSDGKNYVTAMKNIANTSKLQNAAYVIRATSNILSYELPIEKLEDSTSINTPPSSTATINYVKDKTIVPDNFKKYNVSFTYDGSTITITNTDNLSNLLIKFITDHFVIKSALNISFIEITGFTPLISDVIVLDTQIYYDMVKLSARINTNKAGTYNLLLIAG